jgi:hypothetical protein
MDVKKYFEFFTSSDDEDKDMDRRDLVNELLFSLEELIGLIDDKNDIEKIKEIEKIIKKYK